MSTQRLRASNRLNAEHSTGPVTARGRAAVRANAFQHGFYARVPIDDAESHEEYRALLDDFLSDLRPAGAVEIELTHRYVAGLWKLSRMERVERAIILGHAETTPFEYPELDANAGQQAFLHFRDWVEVSMCQYTTAGQAPVERLHLLQNRLRRSSDSTLRLLTTLQAERLQSAAFADSPLDPNSSPDALQPAAPASSMDPVAPSVSPPSGPPVSPAGEDRARRISPEVRARAARRAAIAPPEAPSLPAASPSPAGSSQPLDPSPLAATSQPDPAAAAASKTKPAHNVTPPTPCNQKPNPGIGFVPHNRKPSRPAAPHSPPKAA